MMHRTAYWQDTTRLELVLGNIVRQSDMEVVVNASNAFLMPGGGVAGAIHAAAGPDLLDECRKHVPLRPGDAVLTGAYGLPNRWVIHCLGPVYGSDKPPDRLLAACFQNALKIAAEHGASSIAFPAISTGAFGYPLHAAALVSVDAVRDTLAHVNNPPGVVRFVLHNEFAFRVFRDTLASATRSDEVNC